MNAQEVACWDESGRCFVVKDKATLEIKFFPKFFNPIKYSSFVKQLNNYGFVNKSSEISAPGEDSRIEYYFHPSFRKGETRLLNEIQPSKKRLNKRETVENLKDCLRATREENNLLQDENRRLKAENDRLKYLLKSRTKHDKESVFESGIDASKVLLTLQRGTWKAS